MAKVGGEKHLLTEDSAPDLFNARLGKPLEEEMLKKIDHLRHRSNLYLDGALALKHVQFA
jgi:hypothetical protein